MGKQLEFQEIQQAPEQAPEPQQAPEQAPQQAPQQAPEETPKKETRGRKKGVKNSPKEPKSQDSEFGFFDEAKKAAEAKKLETTPEPNPSINPIVEQPSLVTGYMLLIICDAFIPTIVAKIIAKRTGKKAAVKKMSKEQLKEMQPLADAAAKKMFANVSEVPAFFIAYGCIMLSNQIEE